MKIARAAHLKKNHKIIRPSILPMKIISQGKLRSATREACEYAQTWSRPHKEKPHILPSLTRKTLRAMTPMVSVPPPPKRAPVNYTFSVNVESKMIPSQETYVNKKGEKKQKMIIFQIAYCHLFADGREIEESRFIKRSNPIRLKALRARILRLCGETSAQEFDAARAEVFK
jgi:hypothetical protein